MNRPAYRTFFAIHGAQPPWICAGCGKPITRRGSHRDSLNVHHKNGNPGDNRPENLEPRHQACHTRGHHAGATRSAEARAAMSAAWTPARRSAAAVRQTGVALSEATRAKVSAAAKGRPGTTGFTGRKHTTETKAKMSAARTGRRRVK